MTHLIARRFGGLNHTTDEGESCSTNTRNAQITINFRVVLIALISLAITPAATAKIYKCDGPDGPVYSDMECEPDAAQVELSTTPGVSDGVYDETIVELAEKKANRQEPNNSNNNQTNISNRNSTETTEPAGRWERNPRQLTDRDVSRDPKPTQQPKPKPSVKRKK